MRVLHIGKFYPPFAGGMEYFLADLLTELQHHDLQVAALVHEHSSTRSTNDDPDDYDGNLIYRVPCYGRFLYAPLSPGFPFRLARVIGEFKPDLLHLHLPNTSAFWAMLIPAARRLPWIIQWHSDVVASQFDRRLSLAYRFYHPFERRLLARSRAIIVATPNYLASSQTLKRWLDKCHIIPLGLNPERIEHPPEDAITKANHIWGDGFRILSVGRLTYYKGHDVLIQAISKHRDLKLIIVGEGERRKQLESLISTLNLTERVLLPGFQKEAELNALFSTCDIFCLASLERTEAFGLVLLECMHFRKPVVACDIPGSGVTWVVQQGGHGVLAKPNDSDALLKLLLQLKRSPQQRMALGEAGGQAFKNKFHIRQVAKQMIELYQNVFQTQTETK
jgi:rhamnosyl/mannosyltransferase